MADPTDVAKLRRRQLLAQASVEIGARDLGAAALLREHLPPGSRVHVTHLPGGPLADIVAQAKALADTGFAPVPHLAARSIASRAELDDYLARLVGEAGATRILIIAGDLQRPRGPYSSSFEAMRTGLLQDRGVRGVSFAAHPEVHPAVAPATMAQALTEKLAYADAHGLDAEVVTQFCFDAAPILGFIAQLRASGVSAPVRIGAPAPTNFAQLLKFAVKCGIGPSLRTLQSQAGRVGRLVGAVGPETLIDELARGLGAQLRGDVASLHFFVFGGVKNAITWLRDQRES